jgi:ATP-binding cassette subfamily A (ABC1) protein 3
VLVDECTSGVDPLSRRALWRTLTSFREDRTIIFTTHVCRSFSYSHRVLTTLVIQFLDEADLLADHIAILAAPGKLVASGSPVSLKRDLGEGYSVQVLFAHSDDGEKATSASRDELLYKTRAILPQTEVSMSSPHQFCYHLKTRDVAVVQQVLQLLDTETGTHGIVSYDILGTTIEDIFLDLMSKNKLPDSDEQDDEKVSRDTLQVVPPSKSDSPGMVLASGRPVSPFRQAFTIFYKRVLIARRSWLTPLLAILVAVAGSTIPLVLMTGRQTSCTRRVGSSFPVSLFLPNSPVVPFFSLDPSSRVLTSPPGIAMTLGNSTQYLRVTDVTDNATFVNDISQNYRNLSLGGISLDLSTGNSLIAWEATPPGLNAPALLNLASNIFYNRALNSTGNSARTPTIIRAAYEAFPPIAAGTLFSLKWIGFYGAVMVRFSSCMQLKVIDGDLSGCIPCFFRTLRLEGETILCPSYATLQRVSRSYRLVAWTSHVRYRHCRHSLNYHHYRIRHCIKSVPWSWLVCQFFAFSSKNV